MPLQGLVVHIKQSKTFLLFKKNLAAYHFQGFSTPKEAADHTHVLLVRHYTQSNGESPRKTSALHIEQSNMASDYAQENNSLSPYRKLLVDLSFDLSKKEVETLKLAGVDFIPRRMTENIATGLHLFDVLEQEGRIGPHNLSLLQDMFHTVGRVDLARKIQAFLTTSEKGKTDGKIGEIF